MPISTKIKLRLGLIGYTCFLLFTPTIYSLYSLIVDGIASILSIAATLSFIGFLESRKPADKNIMNRQMQLNFYLKLVYHPLYYMMIYVGYSLTVFPLDNMNIFLSSTLLSYSSTRIWLILSIIMYAMISASRALLFISPALYFSLQAKMIQKISICIILAVFTFEIVLSQVVFSPEKCEVNEKGHRIHVLMNFFTNETLEENTSSTKACTLFPSFRVALFILITFEVIRLTMALARMWKSLKRKQAGPTRVSISTIQAPPASLTPPVSSNSFLPPVPTSLPAVLVPEPAMNSSVPAFLNMNDSSSNSDNSEHYKPTNISLTEGLKCFNDPPAHQTSSVSPVISFSTATLIQVASLPALEQSSISEPFNQEGHLSIKQDSSNLEVGSEILKDQPSISIQNSSSPYISLPFTHPNMSPLVNLKCSLRRISSVPSMNTCEKNTVKGRKMSLQFTPQLATLDPKSPDNTRTCEDLHSSFVASENRKKELKEIQSYIALLVLRTYSVVVITIILFLIASFLPSQFYFLQQLRVQSMITKIDLFFLPVFWITVDKEVWHYTQQKIKKLSISVKLKFIGQ